MRLSGLPESATDEVDALVTDRYLHALLAEGDLAAADGDAGPQPDPGVRRASEALRTALVRVHPSFRFEERLAGRLAELAAVSTAYPVASDGPRGASALIPFPGAVSVRHDDPLLEAILDGRLDPADGAAVGEVGGTRSPARPLLVGGAITSAAISIVGVAWVAWRASRPGGTPMGRAARLAHARHIADLAAGLPGGPA